MTMILLKSLQGLQPQLGRAVAVLSNRIILHGTIANPNKHRWACGPVSIHQVLQLQHTVKIQVMFTPVKASLRPCRVTNPSPTITRVSLAIDPEP